MNKKTISLLVLSIALATIIHAQPVYKDVAQIFFNRCTDCHHEGAGTPMSLMFYETTSQWSSAIKTALVTNYMPPWLPDTTYTRFAHERIITPQEKQMIIDWIDGGALAGDTTLAPASPFYSTGYRLKGVPDAIIKIPTFVSTATSNDEYHCISVPTNLTQDRIVRAMEIVPGKAGIVHHAVLRVDSFGTTQSDYSGGCFQSPGDFIIGEYAPGTEPLVFPNSSILKAGMTIPAGSKIVFQMHYPAGSAGMIDSTQIRLYFYPIGEQGVRPIHSTIPLQNWLMAIPPYLTTKFSDDYPSNGTIDVPWSIFASFPHSHLLCKKILNYAYNPTTNDTIRLIRINNWDFHFQTNYAYKNLVQIPNGYLLHGDHWYDNTSNNPNNPNSPPKLVFAGTNTDDEMLFDGFHWMYYSPGDENINIDSLLALDPLLNNTTTVPENKKVEPNKMLQSIATPNPFTNNLRIAYNLPFSTNVKLKVFDICGQQVAELVNAYELQGVHFVNWDIKEKPLAGGTYFYSIQAGNVIESGKVVLLPH